MSPEFSIALHNLGVKFIKAMPPDLVQAMSMGYNVYRDCPTCGETKYTTDFAGRLSKQCRTCAKKERKCVTCGKVTHRPKYCSEKCKQAADRYPRICKHCNTNFVASNNSTVYCSPTCKAQAKLARQRLTKRIRK